MKLTSEGVKMSEEQKLMIQILEEIRDLLEDIKKDGIPTNWVS